MKRFAMYFLAVIAFGMLMFSCAGGCAFFKWKEYTEQEIALRTSIEGVQDTNKASFDTMWKIIQQNSEISDQYKEAFMKIYPEIIAGRYKDNNLLFKFVKESNPKFDMRLYLKLTNTVEAERHRFLNDQKKLRDMKVQHDRLIDNPISGFFLKTFNNKGKIDVVIVTSDKTEESFKSGKEDDVKLFKKEDK